MADTARRAIPDHVPEELVYPFEIETAPGMLDRPFETLAELQRKAPPIFYTLDHNPTTGDGGGWVVTRLDYVREILQRHDLFTQEPSGVERSNLPQRLIPLQLDPPEHTKYRVLLAPLFAPKQIDRLEDDVRTVSARLLDQIADKGGCEFVADYALPLPTTIFTRLMGLPFEEADEWVEWNRGVIHPASRDEQVEAAMAADKRLKEIIDARKHEPQDDLVSRILASKVDGKPIDREKVENMCYLLFMAGLDTVASTLGFIFRYLAEHPEAQQRLRDDPAHISQAMEELLRCHAIVQTGRYVAQDMEWHGAPMKRNDTIGAWTGLVNYDDSAFERAMEVDFDRDPNPHITFAAGAHRCVGSHLARREIRIALEDWMRRMPPFRVKPGVEFRTHHSRRMLSLTSLPLEWGV